jgi:hypothetical protein
MSGFRLVLIAAAVAFASGVVSGVSAQEPPLQPSSAAAPGSEPPSPEPVQTVPAPAAPQEGQPAAPQGAQPAAPGGAQSAPAQGNAAPGPSPGPPPAPAQPASGYPPPGQAPPGYYGYPYPPPAYPPPGQGYPPPAPGQAYPPVVPPAPDRTKNFHDGFYLRLGIGAGYLSDSVVADDDLQYTLKGGAMALEVAFGGTPSPGIVIGGGLYQTSVFSPSVDEYELAGVSLDADYESDSADLVLIALLVDAYINPRGGFHLQGGIGPAVMVVGAADDCSQASYFNGCLSLDEQEADGLGLMLGVGYELWAGEQWGVGVLGRLVYASVSSDVQTSLSPEQVEVSHSVIAPALLFSATLH